MISAGDVLLLKFPFSSTEGQPFKKRPVLVLSDPVGRGIEEAILVAMVTSSANRLANPRATDVPLDYVSIGLQRPSVVRVNRLWTAETRDVAGEIGRATAEDLARVRAVFMQVFPMA